MTDIPCAMHQVTVWLCLSSNHRVNFYARLFFFFFFGLEFLFLLASCQSPFPPLKHIGVPFLRKALGAHPIAGCYFVSSSTEVDFLGKLGSGFLENSSLYLCYLQKTLHHKMLVIQGKGTKGTLEENHYLLVAQCYFYVLKGKISTDRGKLSN